MWRGPLAKAGIEVRGIEAERQVASLDVRDADLREETGPRRDPDLGEDVVEVLREVVVRPGKLSVGNGNRPTLSEKRSHTPERTTWSPDASSPPATPVARSESRFRSKRALNSLNEASAGPAPLRMNELLSAS